MDLWIRSQDRKRLSPINDDLYIPISRTNEDFGIFYKNIMLGTYKTKERALKVLDEIQEHIGFLNVEMCAGRFGELDFQSDIIFQMPKE